MAEQAETWTPPLNFEEKLKKYLLPPQIYIKRLHAKELRRGEKEIGLVPFLCHPEKSSLDIGANKGVYAYAMLPHSFDVYAFEPNPKMFDILASWGKGKIKTSAAAIGNENGQFDLRIPRTAAGFSNQGGSLKARSFDADHKTVSVETKKLDDCGIDNIGFIKIDVEGFEMQVLEGAANILKTQRPNLLVEIEEIHNDKPLSDLIADVCNNYNYDCFALRRGQLTPFRHLDAATHFKNRADRQNYIFNFIFLPA
tara:strand:+ start:244 stop:1005 length:762 start_codon:yes stop_codon:yes gene_type:complete